MATKPQGPASWLVPERFQKGQGRSSKPTPPPMFGSAQTPDEQSKASWSLLNVARGLRLQGEYNRAVQYLNQVRAFFENAQDDYGLACSLEELAFCSGELGRNANALEYAHLAVDKFNALGHYLDLAWAYDNLAYIYFYRYYYKESLVYSKKARQIFLKHNAQYGLAWNACNLARIYLEMSLPYKARYCYEQALKLFTELKNEQGRALALLGLGTVYRTLCRFRTARGYLIKARTLYASLQIRDHWGWCVLNEAAIHRIFGDMEKAKLLNKKATQLFTSVRKQDGVGWSLFQQGQLLRDVGYPVKSWQFLREGLNLHKDIANAKGIGWGENEWGSTYLELGDLARARECFVSAKTKAHEMGLGPLEVEAEKNLACVYLETGHLRNALLHLENAQTASQRFMTLGSVPEILYHLTRYSVLVGDLKRADSHIHESMRLAKEYDMYRLMPTLMVALGEIRVRQGYLERGVQIWKDAIRYAQRLEQKKPYIEAMLGLIQTMASKKNADVADPLIQLDKHIRSFSSRKLKAKSLAIRGWMIGRTNNYLDAKYFVQALQVLDSAGMVTLHRMLLGVMEHLAGLEKNEDQMAFHWASFDDTLKKDSVDVDLVKDPVDQYTYFPISVIL